MPEPDPDPEAQTGQRDSYSVRSETNGRIWWNRISVTATLFTTALGTALVLGRRR